MHVTGQKPTCYCSSQVCLSPLSQFFCNVDNPPDIYANMTLDGHCSLDDLVPPMQHMADLHDRFRRRLVYRFGAWRAEVLEAFDVRSLMREVTLDGPDAQQAYHTYMAKVSCQCDTDKAGLLLCITAAAASKFSGNTEDASSAVSATAAGKVAFHGTEQTDFLAKICQQQWHCKHAPPPAPLSNPPALCHCALPRCMSTRLSCPPPSLHTQLMSDEPLGSQGLPPWDVLCIHYSCDPQRTDVLMRASHIIGDGQLFMKLIKQIMEPLDAAARADFHASITHACAGTPGVGRSRRQEKGGKSSSSGGASSSGGGSFSSGGGSSCGRVSDDSSCGAAGGKQQRRQQHRSSSLPQQQLRQRQQQRQQEEVALALLSSQQQQRKKQGGLKRWWQLFVG